MIETRRQAADAAWRFLLGVETPHTPVIFEVVDFRNWWRVFYGWTLDVDLPDQAGAQVRASRPNVVPLAVARQTGHVGTEWPLVKVDTSAQQSMRVLQSEHVAPVMRELGLRGSVNSFRLPSSTHFAAIGFKRSRSSNAAVVFFSVVAQVISREEWRREADRYGLGARPDGHATYGIGSQWVLGPGEWAAYGGLPVEPLAATVIAAVRDAVAALRRFAGEA